MKIRKGDTVRVMAGKDKGREGSVLRTLPKKDKIIVERVNVAKKHQKPTSTTEQGSIVDKDMPISVSNVQIVCPKCGPVRVGALIKDDGKKVRVCKRCGGEL
ncbi:MAG: 50S ribosomal protein L24 [Actinomycetota bacterium]|nr:50S ribosomal protein L24 [Actinomycetota bacterium]